MYGHGVFSKRNLLGEEKVIILASRGIGQQAATTMTVALCAADALALIAEATFIFGLNLI